MKRASLVLPPLLFVCLGLVARSLAMHAWTAFTQYQTPFAFPSAETATASPVVPRVVLVLLDGLRLDASRRMPFLNQLRRRGADLESEVGLPSFSLPGRATLLTGAWPDVHGQTTNMKPRPVAVEHLFQVARRRNVGTALAAGPAPFQLFDPWVDRRIPFPEVDPDANLPALEAELAERGEVVDKALATADGFFMAELISVDEAGHQWGGASAAYARMAARVDAVLRQLVGRLDLTRTTLAVTSDHGHTGRGGHGGSETSVTRIPLVLAGAAVRPGTRGRARHIDLAPTVAVLLGLPIPASSQGWPLLDHLALSPDQARDAAARAETQRRAFLAAFAARLGEPAPAATFLGSDREARSPGDVDAAVARVRDRRLVGELHGRRLKAAGLLGILALAVVTLSALVGWRQLAVASTAALCGFLAYRLAFPLFGLGYSMSILNREEELDPFFHHDMLLAALACLLAAAVAGAWRRWRQPDASRLDLARSAWLTGAALVGVFLLRITHAYLGTGLFLTWHMPDVDQLFAFYLDLLALVAVCLAGPLLPVAGWAGAALTGRKALPPA